jgi:hypothetical protein
MENLRLSWRNIKSSETEGKLFYKIVTNTNNDKYYLFCYHGHPNYDKYYDGEKFRYCVFYLKKKINKKESIEFHTETFNVPLNTYLPLYLEKTFGKLVLNKILAEERKEKIAKVLNK